MLKKMLTHGLIATAVIGGAAAVYASGRDGNYSMENAAPIMRVDAGNPKSGSTGYISDSGGYIEKTRLSRWLHEDEHEREYERYSDSSEHRHEHGERDYD